MSKYFLFESENEIASIVNSRLLSNGYNNYVFDSIDRVTEDIFLLCEKCKFQIKTTLADIENGVLANKCEMCEMQKKYKTIKRQNEIQKIISNHNLDLIQIDGSSSNKFFIKCRRCAKEYFLDEDFDYGSDPEEMYCKNWDCMMEILHKENHWFSQKIKSGEYKIKDVSYKAGTVFEERPFLMDYEDWFDGLSEEDGSYEFVCSICGTLNILPFGQWNCKACNCEVSEKFTVCKWDESKWLVEVECKKCKNKYDITCLQAENEGFECPMCIAKSDNNSEQKKFLEKAKAVVIGHAIGDALGVPVEFKGRDELQKNPVTDMRGFGTHSVPAGTWSDDTSMSLCSIDALAESKSINFDLVMINFCRWYYKNAFTATEKVFDIGNTCYVAIDNYFSKKQSWKECGVSNEEANGNGSLMRIHPFALYLYYSDLSIEEKIEQIEQASALTHAHDRSKIGCGIYTFILWELLKNPSKEAICDGLKNAYVYYENRKENQAYSKLYFNIGNILSFLRSHQKKDVKIDEIKSSGYVVDTLEAAIWCLLKTNSYKECVLTAINLGKDTDTVGAIAGGLAGALYGYEAIPQNWRNSLAKREYIEKLCEKTYSQNFRNE